MRTRAYYAFVKLTEELEPNLLFFPEASEDARRFYISENQKWWEETKVKLEQGLLTPPQKLKNE